MKSGSHWFVSLQWETNDVPHCRLLSSDEVKWRLVSATLCWRWSHYLADQLWLLMHAQEEEEYPLHCHFDTEKDMKAVTINRTASCSLWSGGFSILLTAVSIAALFPHSSSNNVPDSGGLPFDLLLCMCVVFLQATVKGWWWRCWTLIPRTRLQSGHATGSRWITITSCVLVFFSLQKWCPM